jgi:hypothetical protein
MSRNIIKQATNCQSCRGTGACKRCIGTGHDPVFGYNKHCVLCNGSGVCSHCSGLGQSKKKA